jgi:hypothetical protein
LALNLPLSNTKLKCPCFEASDQHIAHIDVDAHGQICETLIEEKTVKHFIALASVIFIVFMLMTGCGKDNPVGPGDDGLNATGCVIKAGDVQVIRAENSVTGEFLLEERVQSGLLSFYLVDKKGNLFQPSGDYILAWTVKNQMLADVIQYEADGAWNFRLKGFEAGTTSVSFIIMDDEFESLDIPITVSKSSGGGLNK